MKTMSPFDFDNPDDISMYYTGCYLGYTENGEKKPCYVRNFYDRHGGFEESSNFKEKRSNWEFMIRYITPEGEENEKFIRQEDLIPYPPYTTYLSDTTSWLCYETATSYKKGLLRHNLYFINHAGRSPEENTRNVLKAMTYTQPNPVRIVKDKLIYKGAFVKNERMLKCLNLIKTMSESKSNLKEVNQEPVGPELKDGTGSRTGLSGMAQSMSYLAQQREMTLREQSQMLVGSSRRSRASRSRPAAPPMSTSTFEISRSRNSTSF